MKTRNQRDKEFHLWIYRPELRIPLVVDYYGTRMLLDEETDTIHSTCSALFKLNLLDRGYRLFVHLPNRTMHEIAYGEETPTGRIIRPGLNIEKLVLSGEFGPVSPYEEEES